MALEPDFLLVDAFGEAVDDDLIVKGPKIHDA